MKTITLLLPLLFLGCAAAPTLQYGGVTYLGKNAQEATLGAIGVENNGEFESKMIPNLKGLPVRLAAKYSSSTDFNSNTAIDAGATYTSAGGRISGEIVKQNMQSGNFQILKLADINKLIHRLNNNRQALDWLKRDNARVVTSVVIAYDARYHSVRNITGSATASITGTFTGADTAPQISFTTKSGKTTDLKIADGFVLGYEMSAPKFDKAGELLDLNIE